MSWKASAYVKTLTNYPSGKKLNTSEKCLLYTLADYYDDESGQAWPSTERLAEESLLSRRHALRITKALSDGGIIDMERRHNQSSLYRFPDLRRRVGVNMSPTPEAQVGDIQGQVGDIAMSKVGDIAVSPKPTIEPPSTTTSKEHTIAPSKKPKASRVSPSRPEKFQEAIDWLWAYYIQKLNKDPSNTTLTRRRREKAGLRLDECLKKTGGELKPAVALMKTAIDRLAGSEFHRSGGFTDWSDHLFHSPEKLEKWLDRGGGKSPPVDLAADPEANAAEKVRKERERERQREREKEKN